MGIARDNLIRLYQKQGGLCSICGGPMVLGKHNTPSEPHIQRPLDATRDHVIPRTRKPKVFDVRAAHRACNALKGDLLIAPFPLACYEVQR